MANQTLTVMGAAITANAAAVAAAIGGVATTANVQGIGDLITTLGLRPELSIPALQLTVAGKTNLIP